MKIQDIKKNIFKRGLLVFWMPIIMIFCMALVGTLIFHNILIFIILVIIDIVLASVLSSYTHILNIRNIGFYNENYFFEHQIKTHNNSILSLLRKRPRNISIIDEKLIDYGFSEIKQNMVYKKK